MKHRRVIRLAAVIFSVLLVAAELKAQQKPLTLQETIALSVKNSKELKGSQARIEAATAALREAVDKRLPDAGISGSYIRLNKPNVELKTKGNSSNGGNGSTQNPNPTSAAYGIANLSLPVFSGFRIKYGIESAKYLEQAAKLNADNDREARAAVDLVNENLQAARQRAADFENLEKNGLLPRNDLLKAQLQVSNTELSLLDAQNNWKLSNINMDLMLGLPENTELVTDSTSLTVTPSVRALDDYVQAALQKRKDLSALGYRQKAASTNVKAVQGEKYPSLALTGGYIALNVPSVLTVTNAVNLGIGMQYSLSSLWKNKARLQQAQAQEREMEASQELLTDAIRRQVNQAYQNLSSSQKKIEVYHRAVEQANENYRVIRNKYANALATTTELLDADAAQLNARMNYAFAKSDGIVAYHRLLLTAGLLNPSEVK